MQRVTIVSLWILGIIALITFMVLFSTQQYNRHQRATMPQWEVMLAGVHLQAWVASTPVQQRQGLAGRASLAADEAMLFPYPDAAVRRFWMAGMQFPIDIIWLRDNQVIGWQSSVAPPVDNSHEPARMQSPAPADAVLEVAAGFVDRFGLAVGDRLTILTE